MMKILRAVGVSIITGLVCIVIWAAPAEKERVSDFTWAKLTPNNSPPPRYAHCLAYDSVRKMTVLFGGWNQSKYLNDTWEWDGRNWSEKTPKDAPPARSMTAMAYDSNRKVTVLFGGLTASNYSNDTWEYDGANWNKRLPETSPPPLWGHKTVYDSDRTVVVLFGGYKLPYGKEYADSQNAYSNETWEWDGQNWVRKSSANLPPGLALLGMAYDASRKVTVVYGGESYSAEKETTIVSSDTFEWDGKNWSKPTPLELPPARASFTMVYDSERHKCIVSGGYCSGKLNEDVMWEWDGQKWEQIPTTDMPPGQFHHDMVYDSARQAIVLFGGDNNGPVNQTWEYK